MTAMIHSTVVELQRERTGNAGRLYIVATPIGNLEDITLRAIRVLKEVELIVCEDTRVSGRLLSNLEIRDTQLMSMNARTERTKIPEILSRLQSGSDVACVSDAGTPGMSDPGGALVAAAVDAGIRVESIPGPNAAITALAASGLPTRSFLFEGFLPHKKGRMTRLNELADYRETIILYESPHRILRTLRDLSEAFGEDRPAAIGRELTKMYEEYNRGTLRELLDEYDSRPSIKGEFVLIVAGAGRKRSDADFSPEHSGPAED